MPNASVPRLCHFFYDAHSIGIQKLVERTEKALLAATCGLVQILASRGFRGGGFASMPRSVKSATALFTGPQICRILPAPLLLSLRNRYFEVDRVFGCKTCAACRTEFIPFRTE
jgi:hypothetical protein